MADSESMAGDGGSWWGGWLQVAKDKSASAMEFVKKDLVEFTSTMQRDTTTAVEVTKTTLNDTLKNENTVKATDKMKQGLTGFFDGLSKALTIPPQDDDDTVIITAKDLDAEGGIYDRLKVRLHAIQVDPGTYLNEPSGSPELFEHWLETFNMESQKGDISELLVVKVEVRGLYTKLVPSELSHSEFWQRYFYKVHQLQLDEARKQALMRRAETPTEDDTLGWEDDWSGDEGEEFEEVSGSEVKTIQQDVQERLSPKPVEESPKQSQEIPTCQPTDNTASPSSLNDSIPLKTEDKTVSANNSRPSAIASDQQKQDALEDKCDSTLTIKDTVVNNTAKTEEVKHPEKKTLEEKPAAQVVQKEPVPSDEPTPSDMNLKDNTDVETKQTPVLPLSTKEADLLTSGPQSNSDNTEPEVTKAPQPQEQEQEQSVNADNPANVTEALKGDNLDNVNKALTGDNSDNVTKAVKGDNSAKVTEALKGDNSDIVTEAGVKELKIKEKGDLVVVGSDRESPTSDSSGNKDYLRLLPEPSVDDDWEQDFDVELTEEDLKAAEEIAKKMGDNLDNLDDDWENWE